MQGEDFLPESRSLLCLPSVEGKPRRKEENNPEGLGKAPQGTRMKPMA